MPGSNVNCRGASAFYACISPLLKRAFTVLSRSQKFAYPGLGVEVFVMRACLLSIIALSSAVLLCPIASAEDFRIETKVYAGKDKTAVSHNTTLFKAGYVYDYLSDPDRVAVFDKPHGRFILLDPTRKLKTEIKTDDVLTFATKFHDWAAKSANAFMRFAADPKFDVSFSEDGKLTLSSGHINYRLQTEPAKTPEGAEQYREFSDWYARFNAMSNPGSTPPFARMTVNAELADRGLVPAEVQLTIPPQARLGVRAVAMRSEHKVDWKLLQRDAERIVETANPLAAFKLVEFSEFQESKVSKR